MTAFVGTIGGITAFFLIGMSIIMKTIETRNRGLLLILLSGMYFTLFFYIAHLMRDSFK